MTVLIILKFYFAGPPSVEFMSALDRCSSLTVYWMVTSDSSCGTVNYLLRLLNGQEVVRMVNITESNFTFESLVKNVNYSVEVNATNMAGDSGTVTLPPGLKRVIIDSTLRTTVQCYIVYSYAYI